MDVEHELCLNLELRVERQTVEGRWNRSLHGVLDGHDSRLDLPALDRFEHLADRRVRHGFEILDLQREQRFFREGPRRAEEGMPSHSVSLLCRSVRL